MHVCMQKGRSSVLVPWSTPCLVAAGGRGGSSHREGAGGGGGQAEATGFSLCQSHLGQKCPSLYLAGTEESPPGKSPVSH